MDEFALLRRAVEEIRCPELSYQGRQCRLPIHHERGHSDGHGLTWVLDLDHERTVELEVERIRKLYVKDA
jgi:hypothetical protein